MSEKVDLRLDWCSYDAAKYAVEHWHYSRTIPANASVKVGVWEDDVFIGCVLFGRGANKNIGSPYGLEQVEVCELVRIALRKHKAPVSQVGAFAIKMLRKQSENLRLIVSYADPKEGHNGAIYQAMNWVYVGRTDGGTAQIKMPNGKMVHKKSIYSRYGTADASKVGGTWVQPPEKHKYLYHLDNAMRKQIEPLRKPYPKRGQGEIDNALDSSICVRSADGGTSSDQLERGDSSSTRTLSLSPVTRPPDSSGYCY